MSEENKIEKNLNENTVVEDPENPGMTITVKELAERQKAKKDNPDWYREQK